MRNKRDKIRRIAAVQARLHRIAEWQLMEVQAREQQLEDKQRRILEKLNDEERLADIAVHSASQSLRAASMEQASVSRTKERLAAHARDEGRKLKQVQRMAQSSDMRALRDDEKRVLADEIEKLVRQANGIR